MLLTLRFSGADAGLPIRLLGGEEERHEEFWFGQALAWARQTAAGAELNLSLLVDVPRIVALTKRRDREARASVGFCEAYAYSAPGLVAVVIAELYPERLGRAPGRLECEFYAYPEMPHSGEIARRLFAPAGYQVDTTGGRLKLVGEGRFDHLLAALPALLLTLDRRTRLFLSKEELDAIGRNSDSWIHQHPARKAIQFALEGRPTPLRFLVSSETKRENEKDEQPTLSLASDRLSTTLIPSIRIAEEQKNHALKMFSRVNFDPRWLVYLPSAVSSLQGRVGEEMERPEAAIGYYRDERVEKVVVEEKHMGSRAIVVLCRSAATASDRFGVDGEPPGKIYTRNGRSFFDDEDTEAVVLDRVSEALSRANFWNRFSTDLVVLDGELLPWATKAANSSEESSLVEAGMLVLGKTAFAIGGETNSQLKEHWRGLIAQELAALKRYDSLFKHYRLQAADLAALKFAPFHLLAVEGRTFFDKPHLWHMEALARIARSGNGFLIPTRYEVVQTQKLETWRKTITWWEDISASGSEGLMIKPMAFVPGGRRGLAQPALKCRTREHLRLVYGPRYDSREAQEALLSRHALLRRRNKHRRILRQFALSMEAVTRFVQRNSMEAVHECILGVLAQEVAPTVQT